MFGYVLALGVILVTGAYAIPVGRLDHHTDSAFLRRPSLEDELRDLPYEDLPKLDEEANGRGMQLISSQSENSRTQEPSDHASEHHSEEASQLDERRIDANFASTPPPALHPSHLIDIDSNVHPSALATGDLELQEHEWRPEDDEKDDDDDDDATDDDEDDDEEDDEDDDHDDVATKPPIGRDVAVEKKAEPIRDRMEAGPTAFQQQQLPPAYIREAYFLAKEDKTDSSVDGDDRVEPNAPTVSRHVETTNAPSNAMTGHDGTTKSADGLDSMKPELARRQESRKYSPSIKGDRSDGQKEQFAEVVVKLAAAEEHDPIATDDFPQAVIANQTSDQQNVKGDTEIRNDAEQTVHRDGGNVEVSNGNNQNRGSSAIMLDTTYDEPMGTAATGSSGENIETSSDVAPTNVDPLTNGEEVDELESELEQEEGRIKDEISERMRSIGVGKQLVKKMMPSDASKPRGGNKEESANEDILELIIKVAERPSSWKEIKELLEKIQYEENTLNKAKARLRALAKQKQMKNRKEQKNKEHKTGKNHNKYNPKDHHNDTVPKEHNFNRAEMTPGEQPKVGHRMITNVEQHEMARVPLVRNDDIIKAEVFPTASRHHNGGGDHRTATKHAKHHHGRRPAVDAVGSDDHDFAIEKPVTVIGERSRIDPVEKELIEASANQRLREIQKEKARLAAIPEPTDEMEQQLKALTKMERRLKEHWRQKQKLIQKIRETNEEHGKW